MFPSLIRAGTVFAVMAAITSTAQADTLSDAQILGIYSQVNSFDIETALLGQLKGTSEQVREIGKMVSTDHTGVRAAAHELATDIGVLPELPPARLDAARDHDSVIATLHGLSGPEFDAAYLKHEIAFHTAAISAVETLLLPEAESPELIAHFEAVLPAFYHHLQMNIDAAEALNVDYSD